MNSLEDIDHKTNALASQIADQLKTKSANAKPLVSVGSFTFQGLITNLGTLMNQNIISALSINSGGAYQVISNTAMNALSSSSRKVDFQITGEMIDLGPTLRIYTRLLSAVDNAIVYSWQTDFQKTMSLMNMINVSGGSSLPLDAFEFDSIDNPLRINLGDENLSRNIHSENDEDWFVFTASQNAIMLFKVLGRDSFDNRMEIYDAQQNEIASNDDYCDGLDAGIVQSLRSGETIYIKVFGYDDETGNYALTVQETEIDDQSMEPNDSFEDAYLLESNTENLNAFFMSEDDEDWYKIIILSQDKALRIFTEGELDTFMELYDENEESITDDDDGGSDYNARINRTLSQGTYFVRVTELDSDSGPYILNVSLIDPPEPDQYEDDNAMSDAKEIILNTLQNRSFTDSDDEDWLYFSVTQSGNYTITAIGNEDTNLDTYIELYDDDGDLLDENDDGGESLDARLRTNLRPGKYFIKTRCLDDFDEPENYSLAIEM
jgi:hypothetical protein